MFSMLQAPIKNDMEEEHSARSFWLDGARVAAITLLLVAHVGQTVRSPVGAFFGLPSFYYVSLGGLAVTIFLVLSGLVLELTRGPQPLRYLTFMISRIGRIYPVYYLALLFGVFIYLVCSYHATGSIESPWMISLPVDLICCLTGFYAFLGAFSGPFLGTSWFIGLIMSLYLIYPFLSNWMALRPHLLLLLLLLVSVASRLILGQGLLPERPLDWFPLCRIFEFGVGVYLGRSVPRGLWYAGATGLHQKAPWVNWISRISFPLFLIHYPLLRGLRHLGLFGLPFSVTIAVYLCASVLVSWLALSVSEALRFRLRSLISHRERTKALAW